LHCEVCLDGRRGDIHRPTMLQLLYFVHVAGSASFAAAARELDVDPSTVLRAVNELEALVGLRLFERSPQRIALTPPGRLVLPLAQRILYLAGVIGTAGSP
jgi:DNA-binding transcriptional LysR family regulator